MVVAPGLRVVGLLRMARVAGVARLTRGNGRSRSSPLPIAAWRVRPSSRPARLGNMVGSACSSSWSACGHVSFERDAPHPSRFDSYGTALWWTAMLLTTMGSDYWPKPGGPSVVLGPCTLRVCRVRIRHRIARVALHGA